MGHNSLTAAGDGDPTQLERMNPEMNPNKNNHDKQENVNMNNDMKEINFTDYAELRDDFTQDELVAIYKRIIADIDSGKV